jgi:hypothetical protein
MPAGASAPKDMAENGLGRGREDEARLGRAGVRLRSVTESAGGGGVWSAAGSVWAAGGTWSNPVAGRRSPRGRILSDTGCIQSGLAEAEGFE